jgi:prepilin-type N-terminal cleavage/methylation domain-containing protein
MAGSSCSRVPDHGFTLIEVLIALGLVAMTAAGVSVLFVISLRDSLAAREQTLTMVLAMARVEELRGLNWGVDVATGLPVSDFTTDLSRCPPASGGPGLLASPPGSLQANTPGFVDYLDGHGNWVGTGPSPPLSAAYIRRWHIAPLPSDPDTLLIRVLVAMRGREGSGATTGGPRARKPGEALMTTLRTRKAG